MPSKVKRETLTALAGLSDAERADLLALFDEAVETERTLEGLRTRVPTDSQAVVDKVEFDKLKETAVRNEELKAELAAKMEELQMAKSLDPLAAFRSIISFLG